MPLSLTIEKDDTGFTVRQGEVYSDHLAPDEALWCAVQFLQGQACRYLRTKEQWDAWEAHLTRKPKPLSETERLIAQKATC